MLPSLEMVALEFVYENACGVIAWMVSCFDISKKSWWSDFFEWLRPDGTWSSSMARGLWPRKRTPWEKLKILFWERADMWLDHVVDYWVIYFFFVCIFYIIRKRIGRLIWTEYDSQKARNEKGVYNVGFWKRDGASRVGSAGAYSSRPNSSNYEESTRDNANKRFNVLQLDVVKNKFRSQEMPETNKERKVISDKLDNNNSIFALGSVGKSKEDGDKSQGDGIVKLEIPKKKHATVTNYFQNTAAPPPNFDPSVSDIESWSIKFNLYAQLFNVESRYDLLLSSVVDECAKKIVSCVSRECKNSYEAAIEMLRNCYKKASKSCVERQHEFTRRTQKPQENLYHFAAELLVLAKEAYPNSTKQSIDEYAKEQFLRGIRSDKIKENLAFSKAQDLQSLLDEGRRAETCLERLEWSKNNEWQQGSYRRPFEKKTRFNVPENAGEEDDSKKLPQRVPQEKIQPVVNNNSTHYSQPNRSFSNTFVSTPPAARTRSNSNEQPKNRDAWLDSIVCHKCGVKGHFSRNCKSEVKQEVTGQQNCINEQSTKNRIVGKCYVNDQIVSFLLDTGADRTIMNADVAKKLGVKPSKNAQTQPLLAANSTPLKTRGIAYVKLVLGGETKTQVVEVVEDLSMDFIIGMDYLVRHSRMRRLINCMKWVCSEKHKIGNITYNIGLQTNSSDAPESREKRNDMENSCNRSVPNRREIKKTGKLNKTIDICVSISEEKEYCEGQLVIWREKAEKIASEISAVGNRDVTQTSAVEHVIELDPVDTKPIRQKIRKIPENKKAEVRKMLDDMLANNMIRESNSPWLTPIHLVGKPDGSIRMTPDYRRLNQVT